MAKTMVITEKVTKVFRRGNQEIRPLQQTDVTLYEGDFLADFYLDDSDAFQDWAQMKREALRRKVLDPRRRSRRHDHEPADGSGVAVVAQPRRRVRILRPQFRGG